MGVRVLVVAVLVAATHAHGPNLGQAIRILDRWNATRAAAYVAGDADALSRLYVPRSGAAAADERLMRAYRRAGAHVVLLQTQVFSARLIMRRPAAVTLAVVERTTGLVDTARQCRLLPGGSPVRRTITLRQNDRAPSRTDRTGWRVAAVGPGG